MPTLDSRSRELLCKVVFAGPVAAGVGTTFRELWSIMPAAAADALIPDADEAPIYRLRYRPKPAIRLRGVSLCFELWGYEARPVGDEFVRLLEGTDGVVLVLDSHPGAVGRNEQAIGDVRAGLEGHGTSFDEVSVLVQYNKRDLPDALPLPQLEGRFNPDAWPFVATSSSRSQGLQDLLDRISSEMIENVQLPTTTGRAPTDSMTSAFERAERKLFGHGAVPSPDDDRTVLGEGGASPFAADPPPGTASPREGTELGPAEPVAETAPEPPPPQPPRPPPRPRKEIDLVVPQMAGHRFVRMGEPDIGGPQRMTVPFVAEPDSERAPGDPPEHLDVVLNIEFREDSSSWGVLPPMKQQSSGKKPRPAPESATTTLDALDVTPLSRPGAVARPSPSPRPKPVRSSNRALPYSWLLFAGALIVVVIFAYLLGAVNH